MRTLRTGAIVLGVATALILTACGTHSTGASSPTAAASGSPAPTSSGGELIIFVSGPSSDPFFGAMAKGAQQAGKDLGVTVDYQTTAGSNVAPADFAQLLDTAIARKPNGLMVSDFFPSAMDPLIKKAVAGGIPAISVNAGASTMTASGSVAFIGQDEYQAGVAGAQQMLSSGITNALCVNHVPGNPSVEARCTGFDDTMKKAGKTAKTLTTPLNDATNVTAMSQDIAGALQADSGVQAVFTLGSGIATAAQAAVKAVDKPAIKVGTCDISTAVLDDVKSGKLLFAIDQQPYLQGYLGVVGTVMDIRYGMHPVGQVSTGPLVISKANVDQVLAVNSKFSGIRGAA